MPHHRDSAGARRRARRHRRRKRVRLHDLTLQLPLLFLLAPSNHLPHRTAYRTLPVLALAIVGQDIPPRIAVRALLTLAFGDVLPYEFRSGAVGGYGAHPPFVFVVGTLSGVVEKDESFLLLCHS